MLILAVSAMQNVVAAVVAVVAVVAAAVAAAAAAVAVAAVVVVAFLRMQESGKSAMCKCLQPILAEVCKEKGAKLYRRFPKFRRHFDLKSSCH